MSSDKKYYFNSKLYLFVHFNTNWSEINDPDCLSFSLLVSFEFVSDMSGFVGGVFSLMCAWKASTDGLFYGKY